MKTKLTELIICAIEQGYGIDFGKSRCIELNVYLRLKEIEDVR